MKTEKELEHIRYDIAMFMPYMPIYKDYEVYDQRALWFQYLGLLETSEIIGQKKYKSE